ncbi:LysR family transcriptional regulator [Achromobacter ruhlandii]|uniref:HTH-type transcriptional regulator DmlR n=2 Tax=Achromobacter TaxID=222 RepID=A0A848NFK7_9BURK|nr:LysR family transcriptional regulator [Achromobacter ruhlandii]ALX86996.1 LysR family transcriptional regulator [Achromobacter denitrificans]AOU92654.1 LysR family transcriptional regulator [Achromobacter ruhlandii]NMU89361.1 LysR family transcriptional regulator [Achromobacter ruhlandii]CAB3886394.1 HTH-type transcriptional regulator DmlR [Achromobacter ruhlandii]CAB3950102.1 HTH-type transcriptional regulator DmlR [Achromobacter ruhlandii]
MALLVAAVDQGSLSGASRVSGVSLASVSRHISALEERLGTRLLVRSTRVLRLTEAGQRYYAEAKRLLAEMDELESSMRVDAAEPSGRLRVTAPTLYGRVHLQPLLAKFLVLHPKVTLDLHLLDRPVNLLEEGIDLAVLVGEQPSSSLVARRLGSIRWVLSAAPDYLARRGTPRGLRDLAQHDGLVYSHLATDDAWTLMHEGRPTVVRVPTRMRSNTVDGVVTAAAAGAGIVHAPAWAIADHVAAGRLLVLLPESETPPRPVFALMTHQRLMAGKVRSLLDFLAQHLRAKSLNEL